jgi:hypothetical protein
MTGKANRRVSFLLASGFVRDELARAGQDPGLAMSDSR